MLISKSRDAVQKAIDRLDEGDLTELQTPDATKIYPWESNHQIQDIKVKKLIISRNFFKIKFIFRNYSY